VGVSGCFFLTPPPPPPSPRWMEDCGNGSVVLPFFNFFFSSFENCCLCAAPRAGGEAPAVKNPKSRPQARCRDRRRGARGRGAGPGPASAAGHEALRGSEPPIPRRGPAEGFGAQFRGVQVPAGRAARRVCAPLPRRPALQVDK